MSEATTNGPRDPMNERLTFTVDEVARLLGVSRSGAYDSITRGEIPSFNIGRRVLVPRHASLEMLKPRPRRRSDGPWGGVEGCRAWRTSAAGSSRTVRPSCTSPCGASTRRARSSRGRSSARPMPSGTSSICSTGC